MKLSILEGNVAPLREDKDTILLDYYQGAYGPTIRIDIQTREKLLDVQNLFRDLADSKIKTVNFAERPSVRVMGLDALILKVISADKEQQKRLELLASRLGHTVFCWSMSAKSWKDCVALTQSLADDDLSGHQYLTLEKTDDALIELAYKE